MLEEDHIQQLHPIVAGNLHQLHDQLQGACIAHTGKQKIKVIAKKYIHIQVYILRKGTNLPIACGLIIKKRSIPILSWTFLVKF
jgi:hypothetical protein